MREFKDLKIAVAGTGYVGLSIATLLSQHHKVTAVDIIPEKVELINNKKSPIQDEYIEKYLAEKELDLTATLDAMDCLIKHQNMIANPRYGMLGLAAMSYQLVVELLGPVFWGVYACLLMWEKSSPFLSMAFVGYVMAQFGLTVISAHIDVDKNMRRLLKWLPKLILTTIEEMLLQILINVARSIGIITFYWRRLVW